MSNSDSLLNHLIRIGHTLKARRLLLNMSQQALADEVGVSRHSIIRLEKGEGNLQIRDLVVIMKILKMDNLLKSMFTPVYESPVEMARSLKRNKSLNKRPKRTVKAPQDSKVEDEEEFSWGEDK